MDTLYGLDGWNVLYAKAVYLLKLEERDTNVFQHDNVPAHKPKSMKSLEWKNMSVTNPHSYTPKSSGKLIIIASKKFDCSGVQMRIVCRVV